MLSLYWPFVVERGQWAEDDTTAHALQVVQVRWGWAELYLLIFGGYGVSRGRSVGKVISYFITTVSVTHVGTCAKASLAIFLGVSRHDRLIHCWSRHEERVGFDGHFRSLLMTYRTLTISVLHREAGGSRRYPTCLVNCTVSHTRIPYFCYLLPLWPLISCTALEWRERSWTWPWRSEGGSRLSTG